MTPIVGILLSLVEHETDRLWWLDVAVDALMPENCSQLPLVPLCSKLLPLCHPEMRSCKSETTGF